MMTMNRRDLEHFLQNREACEPGLNWVRGFYVFTPIDQILELCTRPDWIAWLWGEIEDPVVGDAFPYSGYSSKASKKFAELTASLRWDLTRDPGREIRKNRPEIYFLRDLVHQGGDWNEGDRSTVFGLRINEGQRLFQCLSRVSMLHGLEYQWKLLREKEAQDL